MQKIFKIAINRFFRFQMYEILIPSRPNPARREKINPSRPNPGRREKIKLNFYFLTSLWCLKINLIFISVQLSQIHGTLRVNDYLFKISQSNIKTMLGRDINKSIL